MEKLSYNFALKVIQNVAGRMYGAGVLIDAVVTAITIWNRLQG